MFTICPAPAGMSPLSTAQGLIKQHLPRTCGDEPLRATLDSSAQESAPHLRG